VSLGRYAAFFNPEPFPNGIVGPTNDTPFREVKAQDDSPVGLPRWTALGKPGTVKSDTISCPASFAPMPRVRFSGRAAAGGGSTLSLKVSSARLITADWGSRGRTWVLECDYSAANSQVVFEKKGLGIRSCAYRKDGSSVHFKCQ